MCPRVSNGVEQAGAEDRRSTTGVTPFERDRRRFRKLLAELRSCVENPGHDSFVGNVGPTLGEIDTSDVAVKLGFFGPPFEFTKRASPGHEYMKVLICSGPRGGGGEILLAGPMVFPTAHGTERLDPIATRSKADDRKEMLRVIARWIEAVDALEEPAIYPFLPMLLPRAADPMLARDPLWRRLREKLNLLATPSGRKFASTDLVSRWSWAERLNRLAGEYGVGPGVVLTQLVRKSRRAEWLIYHPAGGEPIRVPETKNGQLSPRALGRIRRGLLLWLQVREGQLREGIDEQGRVVPRHTGAGDSDGTQPTTWEQASDWLVSRSNLAKALCKQKCTWLGDARKAAPTPVWSAPRHSPLYRLGELLAAFRAASGDRSLGTGALPAFLRRHIKAPEFKPDWGVPRER